MNPSVRNEKYYQIDSTHLSTFHYTGTVIFGLISGDAGRHPWPAKVVIVATHSDTTTTVSESDCDLLLATVREKFHADFDISEHVFIIDALLAMSPELKALRTHLSEVKQLIVQVSTA